MGLRISQTAAMRANVTVHVTAADRKRLEALVADRNTAAQGRLARRDYSRHCRWSWNQRHHAPVRQVEDVRLALQERFAAEGVYGLLR